MNKIIRFFCIWLFLGQTAYGAAIAGKYEVVGDLNDLRGAKKVELVEFFNFSCGHCYHFLTTSKRLEKKYKDKLIHISKPIFWGKQTPFPSMAYLLSIEKGRGEETKKEIFDARFKMNIDIFNYRMMSYITSTLGFGEQFEKSVKSDPMKKKVDQTQREANRYGADQTPTIILNGVIKVNPSMTDGDVDKMTDNLDRIIEDILH